MIEHKEIVEATANQYLQALREHGSIQIRAATSKVIADNAAARLVGIEDKIVRLKGWLLDNADPGTIARIER